ncbi:trypsin-like peptidase domain-containing protein [Candidatus Saccharibacteria bacterium]|nr:trypsin-like peptidase domain-containing protein [Candidatus Saccharibacteria bacterium]MBQ9016823.1 trypsin-like peptidase domain-containing protein [Candidatus Saccharibacteria bacterium]
MDKKTKNTTNNFQIVVLTIACVTAVCSVFALGFSIYNYNNSTARVTWGSGVDGNSSNFTDGSIADVANKVSPSVVSITTETRTTSWFGQSTTSSAAGTGMIVSSDGYVLTNKHVVDGANKVNVILDDGTTYENVKVVGTDPANDVAFIKIDGVSDLPAVTLGDSKTMNVGQQVIAIGNALGQFQNTVTEGIVSGLNRSITASDSTGAAYEYLTDLIQTDAAINSGNSGGPLVNAAGQVVGLNVATSSADNIGFAIPISSVKGMLKSVLNTGKAERAYIGVNYKTITPDVAKEYNLSVKTGGYVYTDSKNTSAVISGSPADKAGVKSGDIITAINGVEVGKAGSITALVGEYAVGDTIQLHILRNGGELNLNVTLEAYPTSTKK